MNIKQKITLAFSAIACTPVIVIAMIIVANLRNQAEENFQNSSEREIRQTENYMASFFEAIAENVDYFAKLPELTRATTLKKYLSTDAPALPLLEDNKILLDTFTRYADSHPATAYISFGTTDGGYAPWPNVLELKSYDPRSRPWYKAALAEPGRIVRTDAYYWPADDAVLIGTVRTVNDAQGNLVGVFGVDVSLKKLTEVVKGLKFGESGYLMLVDNNGVVLVDAKNEGHSFKLMRDLGPQYAKMVSSAGMVEIELNGKVYLANSWTSKKLGWQFVGLIERSEVMAKADALSWLIAVVTLALGLCFAAIGAVFAKVLIGPIRSVVSGLEDIAQGEGDLTRTLEVRGRDETSLLARWFNQFLETIRQLVQRIVSASNSLNQTAEIRTQVALDMSNAAERQRGSVEMVSTAFNEMVATASEVAHSCSEAAVSADAGQGQVHIGQARIEQAQISVSVLSENLHQSSRALQALEQDSQNINTILNTIRSIAEQTNLLALNAAIEAARAGEQGRGFAVVADEVRALAKKASDSTGEIDSLLGGLARRTQEVTRQMQSSLEMSDATVEGIRMASESFEKIRGSVDQIRDQTTQIATAAEEQHQVAEEINRHVAQIQGDAMLVEQLAQKSHLDSTHLSSLSSELQSLVSRFRA